MEKFIIITTQIIFTQIARTNLFVDSQERHFRSLTSSLIRYRLLYNYVCTLSIRIWCKYIFLSFFYCRTTKDAFRVPAISLVDIERRYRVWHDDITSNFEVGQRKEDEQFLELALDLPIWSRWHLFSAKNIHEAIVLIEKRISTL